MVPRDIGMTIQDLRLKPGETVVEKAALVASHIPYLGPLASGAALQAVSSRRWDRLIMFISNLQTRLEDLEHLSHLSAEQEDMTAEVFERVVRERSDERLGCYRNILVGVLTSHHWEYDRVEEHVKRVERLTSNDIKLLSMLADPYARDSELEGAISKRADEIYMGGLSSLIETAMPDWDMEMLRRSWGSLLSESILNHDYPSGVATGSSITLDALNGQLSSYGREFVDFVVLEKS